MDAHKQHTPRLAEAHGRASYEELTELQGLLIRHLLRKMTQRKHPPGVELLNVVRLCCNQWPAAARPEDIARLEQLFSLMLDRMIEGLSTASPSATLVAEARALLSSHGIRAGSPLRGLLQLKEDALRLPFDLAVAPEETEQ